jgi:FMN phosphatase YigB (HAD superfamily)
MKSFGLIVFDLDNTVYDWYSAFLPAFYRMVEEAAPVLKCDPETLLNELQLVDRI